MLTEKIGTRLPTTTIYLKCGSSARWRAFVSASLGRRRTASAKNGHCCGKMWVVSLQFERWGMERGGFEMFFRCEFGKLEWPKNLRDHTVRKITSGTTSYSDLTRLYWSICQTLGPFWEPGIGLSQEKCLRQIRGLLTMSYGERSATAHFNLVEDCGLGTL